jgi:hypothetical protein
MMLIPLPDWLRVGPRSSMNIEKSNGERLHPIKEYD